MSSRRDPELWAAIRSPGRFLPGSQPDGNDRDVNPLTSSMLTAAGFRHAFFTRLGGVSTGPYTSLNFSYGVGDVGAHVDRNFELAEAALGLQAGRLVFLSQVHGNVVQRLDGGATRAQTMHLEGDAVVSGDVALGLGVRTADCLPILIADPESGRAAAAHAGWRGLVRGVLAAAVEKLAVPPERLLVAIGPHIGPNAFEVSEDVARELAEACPVGDPILRDRGEKPHVNLARIATAQAVACGIPGDRVEHVEGCTFTDEALFFSYRRDGKCSGRHLSAIVPQRA